MEDKQSNKSHSKTKRGRGAREKKRTDNAHLKGNRTNKSHNVANIGRTKKTIQRNLDKSHQKEYVPKDDRSKLVVAAPPAVVAVMGPKGVGKSTVIKSLAKYYTNANISSDTMAGPITCKTHTGRITLLECPNDVNGMLDTAKVADLVLLVVDAKFGFEMETFEYLNILQQHGFPKVAGVFTHLDQFEKMSQVKKTKKGLKQRFWTDIYDGSKMFYFSGVINGKYLKNEIRLLGMWIQRCKYRPLTWRNTHPYILVDRVDDITYPTNNENDDKSAKEIAFYGYVRGTNFSENQPIHIPGVGDFTCENVKSLPDPLPFVDNDGNKLKVKAKIYAPGSDYMVNADDEGGIYIDLPHINYTKASDIVANDDDIQDSGKDQYENVKIMKSLQDVPSRQPSSQFRLFKGGNVIEDDEGSDDDSSSGDESSQNPGMIDIESEDDFSSSNGSRPSGESDFEDNNNMGQRARRAAEMYLQRSDNLQDMIYGDEQGDQSDSDSDSDSDESSDNFFTLKKAGISLSSYQNQSSGNDVEIVHEDSTRSKSASNQGNVDVDFDELRDKFVTGNWDDGENAGSDGEEYDGFEDLENPQDPGSEEPTDLTDEQLRERNAEEKSKSKSKIDSKDDDNDEEEIKNDDLAKLKAELIEQKKTRLENLDGGLKYTGFQQGLYLKVIISNVPSTFRAKITEMPLILGGLTNVETGTGFVQTRIKKHRWHERILKCKDALIVSAGWRRFQTLPVFYMDEDNGRHRYLKYTPEHMHCNMQYFGHFIPANTGFCCFRRTDNIGGFRVVATGVTLANAPSTNIVKKLKLSGAPYKIYKNTCYVKGIFNSSLEVQRFIGAKIRSVSGVRGQVKKAINEGQPGSFRATFEDKLKLSDIVFIRTWMPVEIPKLNLPILNHCNAMLMRTKAQLAHDTMTPIETNTDSIYKPINRPVVKPAPLKIPKNVEANLPFKSKRKDIQGFGKRSYVKNRKAVILTKDEKQKMSFIQALGAIKNASKADKKERNAVKRLEKERKEAHVNAAKMEASKINKKRRYREAGKADARKKAKAM